MPHWVFPSLGMQTGGRERALGPCETVEVVEHREAKSPQAGVLLSARPEPPPGRPAAGDTQLPSLTHRPAAPPGCSK